MTDQEFLEAFETHKLSHFPHHAHIRMAWLYLRREGWERGIAVIREGIKAHAHAHGALRKYHETITVFWAKLVMQAIQDGPATDRFIEFAESHPRLSDSHLIHQYYSPALLQSETARNSWVEPDLKAL